MTYLHFDNEEHIYTIRDTKTDMILKELMSVTTLLEKHKITTDYSDVPEHIMENARLFGDLNHAYLEKYYKGLATYNELPVLIQNAIDLLDSNAIIGLANEFRVNNDQIAGTIDMVGLKGDKQVLLDFKFTYAYNGYSIQWQLNLYKYLLEKQGGMLIDELYCLWFNKEKKVFELRPVPTLNIELVERILDLEKEGKIFVEEQNSVISRIEQELALDKVFTAYFEAEGLLNKKKADLEAAKQALLEEMENHGIKSYDTQNFKITYVAPSESITYDNKSIVESLGDTINKEQYKKVSTRNSYIKLTDKRKDTI